MFTRQTSDKPNILWICTDQQRWDTIHALGNSYINTPNIDKLVENGVAFKRAYTQCPICTPSRATFLTGRYPATHHVCRNGADYFPSNEVLVTKLISENGYNCGLVGKLHLSRAENRIEIRPDDGYNDFYYSQHPYPGGPEPGDYANWILNMNLNIFDLYKNINGHYGLGVSSKYHQSKWCGDMSLKYILENKGNPWLLSLNFFDPHPPFDPPEEFLNHYNYKELPLPIFSESDIEHQKLYKNIDQQTIEAVNFLNSEDNKEKEMQGPTHCTPPTNYDPQFVKACYYASIEFIDYQLGRILDLLKETEQLDNTVIIFMSDHGELLGDHGLIYKGCRFYESLVHVPFIISYPGFENGLQSNALVELVDLAPTILEILGIDIPYYMQGRSLYRILTGNANPDYHKPYVVSEYNDALNLPDHSHGTMCFDGRYKMAVYHGHNLGELYDLQEDPEESNDLWDNPNYRELKCEILLKHFDAIMNTSSPGIHRVGDYTY